MKSLFCGIFVASFLAQGALAQFHSRSMTGHAAINQEALNSAQAHFNANRPAGVQPVTTTAGAAAAAPQVGFNGASTIYVSEAHRQNYGVEMSEQVDMRIHVWGRSIHHSDGSYTESREQNDEQHYLEQTTYSKNGVEIQRRSISLDQRGRPDEVMIYDGRGKFKYRGKHLYDQMGRFSEEHLFASDGTLIRRKVQEYTAEGKRMPLRSWDYAENIPSDLQLVITRESEDQAAMQAAAQAQPQQPQRNGLFNRNKQQPQQTTGNMMVGHAAPQAKQETAAKPTMGSKLGRLFSNRK